jgi:hypothetical protein
VRLHGADRDKVFLLRPPEAADARISLEPAPA